MKTLLLIFFSAFAVASRDPNSTVAVQTISDIMNSERFSIYVEAYPAVYYQDRHEYNFVVQQNTIKYNHQQVEKRIKDAGNITIQWRDSLISFCSELKKLELDQPGKFRRKFEDHEKQRMNKIKIFNEQDTVTVWDIERSADQQIIQFITKKRFQ